MRLFAKPFAVFGSFVLSLAVVSMASGQATPNPSQPSAQSCDRNCLIGTMDSYLAALVAHDPSRAPIAKEAKFTENTRVIRPGDGLWKSIQEGPTKFRISVPDPVSGQVGFVGVISHSGPFLLPNASVEMKPGIAFLALRLKVQGREITESEALLVRTPTTEPRLVCGPQQPEILCDRPNIETVRPGLRIAVPPGERVSREEMLRIADGYYESIVRSDGDVGAFADDCVRHENGGRTNLRSPEEISAALANDGSLLWERFGGLSCRDQMNTRALSYITSISRRMQIADPETGLVFGLSMFRRPRLETSRKIVGIPGVDSVDESKTAPNNRLWAHVFKVSGGKIHEIEAMSGVPLPLDSKHGWETD